MTWWQGVVLGLVQGLTEFLPISSDGHLDLAKALMGMSRSGVVLDVVLHVATLCAVFWVYWRRLADLAAGALRRDAEAWRYVLFLVIGTIPAGVAGIALESYWAREFPLWEIGVQFLVTGILLWSTRLVRPVEPAAPLTLSRAGLIGLGQAFALFPAVSRSGTTVATGMWLGLDPVKAGEFSFLLLIPAVTGAAILELPKLAEATAGAGAGPLAISFVTSLVSGVFAIRWLVLLLRKRAFFWFAPYCWLAGIVVLVWGLLRP